MPTMRIRVAAVGRLKEDYWRRSAAEYTKRLSAYAQLTLYEVDDVDPKQIGGVAKALAAEHKALEQALAALPNSRRKLKIALDIAGQPYSSERLAQLLQNATHDALSPLFYIGGPNGLDPSLLRSVDLRLSFGPLTLPHNLARVVLLEQLYRACKINRSEPYHR